MQDVVVIGGGVIGLSTAWLLAKEGLRVVVLERDAEVGRRASWAAGGMLAPSAEARFGEEVMVELSRLAGARYAPFVARLEEATGQSLDYQTEGSLVVALDRDDAAEIRHVLDYQRELGLPVKWLGGDEVRALEPYLSPRVVGGVLSTIDHCVDNRCLVEALRMAFEQLGGVVRCNTPGGIWLEGDVCRGALAVQKDDPAVVLEKIEARHTILCAGAWSQLTSGLKPEARPPIRPVKGQMLSVQLGTSGIRLSHTIRTPRVYLVPRSDGRILVGATSEERGFDTGVTAGGVYTLLRYAYEVFPAIYELPMPKLWTGLRPACRDNLPIIGASQTPGLLMATGHYRSGILMAPLTAEFMRDVIVYQKSSDLLAHFSPSRFGL